MQRSEEVGEYPIDVFFVVVFFICQSDYVISWDRTWVSHRSLGSNHTFAVGKMLSSIEGSRRKKQPNKNIDLWFLV